MNRKKNDDMIGKIIFNKYKIEKKLGEGSFGKIYTAVCLTNGEYFALKMETKDSGQSLLETEAYILCYLKGYGIPSVKSYGFSGEHNVLVMELLGKSLEDLFQEHYKKFTIETTCMIGLQMIGRIEAVHNKNIIHRDIKPDNFVIGRDDKEYIIYLLDFGLSKKYKSSRTNQHIKFTMNKKLTGTARYASINALKGFEQSRRDDLEAIGYVLLYFLRGSLPWQGLQIDKREDRYKKIYDKKKDTTAESLCAGFPSEFVEYVTYTRNLEFEAVPDYEYLKNLFKKVLKDRNRKLDYFFDWSHQVPNIKKTQSGELIPNTSIDPKDDMIKNIKTQPNFYEKKNGNCNQENILTENAIYNMTVQNTAENQEGTRASKKKNDNPISNSNSNTNSNSHSNNRPQPQSAQKEKQTEELLKDKPQDQSGKCLIV